RTDGNGNDIDAGAYQHRIDRLEVGDRGRWLDRGTGGKQIVDTRLDNAPIRLCGNTWHNPGRQNLGGCISAGREDIRRGQVDLGAHETTQERRVASIRPVAAVKRERRETVSHHCPATTQV